MIKIILILSSVMLVATAVFGVLNRTAYIEEKRVTQEVNDKWKVVNGDLIQMEETLQDAQEELKTEKDVRDEQDAKLTLAKEKQMQKERSTKQLEQRLNEEKLKLKEMNVVLEKFKDPATGEMPSVETLKDKREGMKQEVANKTAEIQSLDGKVKVAEAAANASAKAIQGHVENQRERSASLKRNAFQATITAVNNDWGFVIVDAGKNKGMITGSPLLVSTADGRMVGKLKIISIEPTITIADIDRSTLSKGLWMEPGQKVLYEKIAE